MRIVTADETGLIKVVRLESGECLAVSAGEQAREHAVRAICHKHAASPASATSHPEDGHCGSVHVVRSAGAVETWDMSQSEREGSNGNACSLTLDGTPVECPSEPVAIAALSPGLGSSEVSRVLTCSAQGEVQVVSYAASGPSKQARFSIRAPISAAITAATSAAGQALAAGGRNNDLKIWDINTNQCTWKAKNVPHDFLDMQQPVWITSLRSLLPGANSGSGGDGDSSGGGGPGLQQLVAGTAHRQVRLYDARAQKRPTHSVDADEHGVTTMAVAPDGKEVVVADTAGLVRVLDLRKMVWGRRFEGPAGSVRGLAFHPTLPVLACVGLDRMARVFDYRSREQKFQVYLKQRLNAVLFDGEGEVRVGAGTAQAGDKKEGRDSGKGEDWSGSEGWGSGEEYEMDEGDSSEEEEEEEEGRGVHKRRARAGAANGRGRAGSSGSSSSEGDRGGVSGSESDDSPDERREGGRGSDSSSSSQEVDDDSESESKEEEEAQAPPPKRQSVKANGSLRAKKSRRK